MLQGHKQNLVQNRTQEKGAVAQQETDPDLSLGVQESLMEAWVGGGLCRVGGTEWSSATWDLLKEVFIASIRVWPQVK